MKLKKAAVSMLITSAMSLVSEGLVADDDRRVFKLKNGRVTASQVSTTVDVNGDGFTGNLTTGFGRSNYGRLFGRSVSEISPVLSDPADPRSLDVCIMPDGYPGAQFELAAFNGVLRIEGLRSAVMLKKEAGNVCLELNACFDGSSLALQDGCKFNGDWRLQIVGGLDRLEGASGYLTLKGDGITMLAHETGNFAGFNGVFEGDIVVPRKTDAD